jgi:hypothetical protein
MESFGRISLFSRVCPWHLLGFSDTLDSKLFFGFGWRFFRLVFRIPDYMVFVGYRDLLAGFHGMSDKRFSGLWISIGSSRFGFSGFQDLWIYGVLRIFGF